MNAVDTDPELYALFALPGSSDFVSGFFLRVPSRTLITFTSFVAGYLIRISLFTAIRIGRTNQRKLPH